MGTVEDMSTAYIKDIRTVQSHGPFVLGGWSLGGVVAYEIARQLHADGELVGHVIMFDSHMPRYSDSFIEDDPVLLKMLGTDLAATQKTRISLSLRVLRRLTHEDQIDYFVEQGIKAGIFAVGIDPIDIGNLFMVFKRNKSALNRYRPQEYSGKVIQCYAENSGFRILKDKSLGWSSLARAGVEVIAVPGDHYTILQKPGVEILAQLVRSCLG